MRKLLILLAALIAAATVTVASPAAGKQDSSKAGKQQSSKAGKHSSKGAKGGFNLSVHTHSGPGLLFPWDRLSYGFDEGEDFAYSSRPCSGFAPFNEIGLDFRPDYPGVDDDDGTAPVRHHVQGEITDVKRRKGTLRGTITSVLCVRENGASTESEHSIVTRFRAKYRRVSDNEVRISGKFALSPTQSTGTFEDIRGRGSIKGIFTCLGHVRDPSAPTCEDLGYFTDFVGLRGNTSAPPGETVPGLKGSYRDPTVEPL